MKMMIRKWSLSLGAGLLVVGAAALAIRFARADDVPQPILKITQTDSNRFQIQITNAVSYANYEVYRTVVLNDPMNFPWTAPVTGALGQAIFNVMNTNSVNPHEFFRAGVGSDWDGDGILNWQDSQPSSTNGGFLRITIEFPASNGTVP